MKLFERKLFVSQRMRWVEDAAPAVTSDTGRSSSFIGAAIGQKRILFFGFFGVIFLGLLLIRVIQIQIVQNAAWRTLAEHNRLRIQPIIPERGIIFDRSMVPLVTNVPNFRLTLRAQDLPRNDAKREVQIRAIAATVGVQSDKIDQILNAFSKYRYASVVIKDPVTYEEVVDIYLRSAAFPSLTIERGAKRKYVEGVPGHQTPLPESMAHVLGFLGRISPDELETLKVQSQYESGSEYYPSDSIGKTGIEAVAEQFVRGAPGERGAEVDARGAERGTVSVKQPTPGASVVLTIDIEIQKQLESALKMGLAKAGKKRGSAIAIDPRDGSVLGLVSLPAYDGNLFADSITPKAYADLTANPDQPLVNRAIGGLFPAGSTVKPFLAAAALQEHVVTPETKVLSTGGLHLGAWFFPDWKAGGHGLVDVRSAIANSVNTYFYTIGGGYGTIQGLGPARIKQYLEYFGLGSPTGIPIPGESRGFLPSPEWKKESRGVQWYIGDTYNISIGQGDILVSPLQLAMGIAAIANNGTLWKPRVIDYRINKDGTEIVESPSLSAKIPIDGQWLQVVREGMRQTVTGGSARSLGSVPIEIAGKTGTAQWSSTKPPHAWFESFAPYQNPEIVTLFMIEEGNEGSTVCVPAAKQFYTWWAEYRKNRAGGI